MISLKKGWQVGIEEPVLSCGNRNGEIIGLKCNGSNIKFEIKTRADNNVSEVIYYADDWVMTDSIIEISQGFFEVERCWGNLTDMTKDVILIFEALAAFNPDFYLIPCVNYNGNNYGTGNEPKGLAFNNEPWIFAYYRSGLPSATFSENGLYSVGIFAHTTDERSMVSAGSMERTESGMIHRLYWPDIEGPVSYKGKDSYGPPINKTIQIRPKEEYKIKFYISISKVKEKNTGWVKTYDDLFNLHTRKYDPIFSPEQVWQLGIGYAERALLHKNGDACLFEMGLLPEGEHDVKAGPGMEWKHRKETRYEIGWCGQNASLACAMIYDYLKGKDEKSLQMGVQVLDTWERKARVKNGLFYVKYDDILSGKMNVEVDTCNLGWGAWQIMNAYLLAKAAGVNKPLWLDMGIKLCDFFVEKYNTDSMFGKVWNIDGFCVDETGTAGVFILLPMLEAFKITKEERYINCAVSAFKAYVARDLNRMECTAGALDTCCIDKETCWPLLKTALDLYEITNEEFYLNAALKAGYYLLSWMYHYDVLFSEDSDFNRYNYHTYGATAVSTQHHHLDPWGALICCDWLRLYRHTGDNNWKRRAHATWSNSLLCMSDGNLRIHGMLRPEGSQNEAFFHCEWAFSDKNKISRGSMNDWLVSWPCAFKLVTLMREKDWNELLGG